MSSFQGVVGQGPETQTQFDFSACGRMWKPKYSALMCNFLLL